MPVHHPGFPDFVPDLKANPQLLDALCMLAGVNYSATTRVLAAMQAMTTFVPSLPVGAIIESRNAADCPVRPADPAHSARANKCKDFVTALVVKGYADDYWLTLQKRRLTPRR